MPRSLMITLLLMAAIGGHATAKSAGNRPYVATFDEQTGFYARCLPAENTGSKGTTQVLCLRPEGDELITTYAWFNRNGLVMGWSPKAGKVAVMRVRQDEGLAAEKQIEFVRRNADPIWLLQNGMHEELHQWELERDKSESESGNEVMKNEQPDDNLPF